MSIYYLDTENNKQGPYSVDQIKFLVKKRAIVKSTIIMNDHGKSAKAEKFRGLVFPADDTVNDKSGKFDLTKRTPGKPETKKEQVGGKTVQPKKPVPVQQNPQTVAINVKSRPDQQNNRQRIERNTESYPVRMPISLEDIRPNRDEEFENILAELADMRPTDMRVDRLVRSGADLNAVQADGTTYLIKAIQQKDAMLAGALLRAGADPNLRTRDGVSPFQLASSMNSIGSPLNVIIIYLVRAGANPNENMSAGMTALHLLAILDRDRRNERFGYPVAEVLLRAGADPNAQDDENGMTPLHLAAANGSSILLSLIAHNADVNIHTKVIGKTPMHFAAQCNRVHEMEVLCEHGADPNLRDFSHKKPIYYAKKLNADDAVEYLKGINAGRVDWYNIFTVFLMISVLIYNIFYDRNKED